MPRDCALHPFDLVYGSEVLSWVLDSNDSRNWANLADVPADPSIFAAWHTDPDVRAFVLLCDGTAVGYGEIWIDSQAGEVELARILVKPACRGSGMGRRLADLLLAEAAKSGLPDAFLRVHPDNATAIACYHHAGFRRIDAGTASCWNRSQPVEYAWLQRSLPT